MKNKTFFFFVGPSLLMMVLFIALPLIFVFIQSFYTTTNVYQEVEVESCTPSFTGQTCETAIERKIVYDQNNNPVTVTKFVGLDTYRTILHSQEVAELISDAEATLSDLIDELSGIDFYRALRFTLTFTLFTLPFVIFFGICLALVVNRLFAFLKGPFIFISLLPFIITPVIGAISIKWLFIGDGIATAFIEYLLGFEVAIFANEWAIEFLMMFYRIWHVVPFAFIVFYAGLQSVNQDSVEAAIIDGATRFQRIKYIVIPHLTPLIVFITLIHLMDSFRVFEEVIGFSSEAYRISLQWLTYDFLTPDDAGNRSIPRASASSMLIMIGIIIILIPVLRRTWRDHKNSRQ